jgi:predicted nucleic acid-binding protein
LILIDAGPLVALAEPRDPYNARAAAELERVRREPLATCVPVLAEACFHLSAPHVRRNLRQFMEGFGVNLIGPANAGTFLEVVFDWLEKYSEHTPDFADGWVAVLCAEEERLKLWTFDREFRTHWRRPDGTPIPLAIRE